MGVTVFVDNLPGSCTEQQLQAIFAPFGPIQVIVAKRLGQHLGFGFVVCADATAAERAIAGLNGMEITGHRIRVCRTISPNPKAA